ncbi:trimeric intracellular cation channel family protein [Ohtaekwangia sp.]|uniref:trimeric intracellular cation channel family protein n=1 Tax=Ohtaekwangia sp. TaxID=2066019 RepID=UPI002F93C438
MSIQYSLELFGTFFFAVSGALAIQDKEHDWFGAGFTGFVTAIGGGSLRDMILGSYPLVWVGDIYFVYSIIVGVGAAIIFYKYLIRLRRTFFLFDTFGIAFFTVLGVEKSLSLGVRPEIAAIMGMFSAIMGGVIRDTLTNETPIIFRKEIYATACLAGAVCYLLLDLHTTVERNTTMLLSAGLIITIRLVAVKFRLSLPELK